MRHGMNKNMYKNMIVNRTGMNFHGLKKKRGNPFLWWIHIDRYTNANRRING